MATATSRLRAVAGARPSKSARALAAAGAALVLAISACGAQPGQSQGPSTSAPSSEEPAFGWFRAMPAPVGWKTLELPDGTAKLAVPPEATLAPNDPGSVSAQVTSTSGDLVLYFNATPRQGDESQATWADFRLDHLADENGSAALRVESRTGMAFLGGQGSCVSDSYVTRTGGHQYREIACFVEGAHGGSVLVVAAPTSLYESHASVLEQAVDSYTAE